MLPLFFNDMDSENPDKQFGIAVDNCRKSFIIKTKIDKEEKYNE